MPLRSKSQERFLWAKHPDIAQEFEDKTSKSQKEHLPEHVKKMAEGGEVEDDQDQAINKYLQNQFVPRGTIQAPQPPIPSTPFLAPTDSGKADETNGADNQDERIQSSHPGHSPSDLENAIDSESSQIDKYGPEQENALFQNILKEQKSIPYKLQSGLATLADAIGQAGGASPTVAENLADRRKTEQEMALNAMPTLQKMNLTGMEAKQKLDEFDPNSPFSKSTQESFKPFAQMMGISPEQVANMSGADIHNVMALSGEFKGKEMEAMMRAQELKVEMERLDNQAKQLEQMGKHQEAEDAARQSQLLQQRLEETKKNYSAVGARFPRLTGYTGPTKQQAQNATDILAGGSSSTQFIKTATGKNGEKYGWDGKTWQTIK